MTEQLEGRSLYEITRTGALVPHFDNTSARERDQRAAVRQLREQSGRYVEDLGAARQVPGGYVFMVFVGDVEVDR